MKKIRDFVDRAWPALAVLAVLGALYNQIGQPAQSQPVPSVVGPYNLDLQNPVINNVAAGAGIVSSAGIANIDQIGGVCVFLATAQTGVPSTIFAIQGLDVATGVWFPYVTSPAITQINVPYAIGAYNGIPSTAPIPANMTVVGVSLPRTWRVQETIAGSGTPTVTAKIGCNVLK